MSRKTAAGEGHELIEAPRSGTDATLAHHGLFEEYCARHALAVPRSICPHGTTVPITWALHQALQSSNVDVLRSRVLAALRTQGVSDVRPLTPLLGS
ncbi:hypothetical protein, partial [Intrasporangium chromatireducens]|uniref:hypothetical protein n=1 Tax=Intrasporangium chromatireducens TaxID=1386088 RepID=UPI001969AC5C